MEILEQKEKGKTQFLLLDAVLLSAMRPGVRASINNYDLRVDLLFFLTLAAKTFSTSGDEAQLKKVQSSLSFKPFEEYFK